jgi:hypothetical protein
MERIPIFPALGIIGMFFLMGCQSSLPWISFAGHLYNESDSSNGPVYEFLTKVEAQNPDVFLWGGDVSDFGAMAPSTWVNFEKKWKDRSYLAFGNHDLASPQGYEQKAIDSLPPFQFYELSDSVKLVIFQTVQKSNFRIDSVVFMAEMNLYPIQILLMHHPLFWDGVDSSWKPNAGYGSESYQISTDQNFHSTWMPLLQEQANRGHQIWCLAGDFGKLQLQNHRFLKNIHFVGVGGNGKAFNFAMLKPKRNRYSIQFIPHP